MRRRKREGVEGGEKERDKGEEGGQVEGGERTSRWQKRTEWQHQIHKALKVMISLVPRLPRSGMQTLKLCRRGEPGIFFSREKR